MFLKLFVSFVVFNTYAVTVGAQNCFDALGGLCPSMQYLCNNTFYLQYMGQNCRLTCGLCTPPPTTTLPPALCYDQLATCQYSQYLCNFTSYIPFMTQYCPLTCGLCTPTETTPTPCQDKIIFPGIPSSCPAFAGLCNVPGFEGYMKEYCAKTCGHCSSATPSLSSTTTMISTTSGPFGK